MRQETVLELSRKYNVSRQQIYRMIKKRNLIKKQDGEYKKKDWDKLKNELKRISENNKKKLEDSEKIRTASEEAKTCTQDKKETPTGLAEDEKSTLKERLAIAKQEFNYNRSMIVLFQREIDKYVEINKKTTMQTHNGTEAAIPAISSLEKYSKLNVTITRLISELETETGADVSGGDSPFE